MLKDNSLGNRLNAVKEGQSIPSSNQRTYVNNQKSVQPNFKMKSKNFFLLELNKTFQVLLTSTIYGFGIETIFAKDWTFIGILGVGLIANHIFSHIIKISLKLFNK